MKPIDIKLSNKIKNITEILAIFVVIIHSYCATALFIGEESYRVSFIFQQTLKILADCAVPLFFMISSYLMFVDYRLDKYKQLLKKRFRTVLIPYILWALIGFGIYAVLSRIKVTNETVEISFVTLIQSIITAKYNPPIWFLRTLYQYVILSPIIFIIIKKMKQKSILICLVCVIVNLIYVPKYTSALFWLPVYLFAAIVSYLKIKLESK
ncbi:acyltransferase family protein [Blautia sp. HCP3S3_D9]|uniref:acyltransferase family protein n=1 Tax=Blautia sp. HCP3S3_D9 TaxID=3438912 RepID=UPI003F8A32AF